MRVSLALPNRGGGAGNYEMVTANLGEFVGGRDAVAR